MVWCVEKERCFGRLLFLVLVKTRLVQVLCGSSVKQDLFDFFSVLFFLSCLLIGKGPVRETGDVGLETY